MKTLKLISLLLASGSLLLLSSCKKDDPKPENIQEAITKATLTFTPTSGAAVVVTATDPDGDGSKPRLLSGPINLVKNVSYTLTITLINELAKPTDPRYDVTAEVEEEKDEHIFFFAWTNNTFSDPTGDGNVDSRRDDAVNYKDEDEKGLPLGLETSWTTINKTDSGTFQVILKHQPGLKSATTTSTDGKTDLNVTFDLTVK
ncbi:MAG: hypothetical protein ORN54_04750 [Cyclobacteriaceae bacterium]|nr:hypothetical protein [Cyclobacteriaceae bacterium]